MPSGPVSIEIGNTVGDYQIVSLLGRGGMGRVFKVRNLISDRVEAMKILLSDADQNPDLAQRFVREIKVVAGLEHPNIASLRTALRVGNQLLMIMEYVEGNSLDDVLKRERLEIGRAVHYAYQALNALSYAHRQGVVHRDVKPANILIGANEKVKLTDFGIASRTGDPRLTATGTALGSLYYMSPEQVRAESADARSDIYSVGATMYEMITGKRPVQGDSFYAIIRAHTEEKLVPPIQLVPEISPALSRIIEKSLEKVPAARFQTAEDFRTALISLPSTSRTTPAESPTLEESVPPGVVPRSTPPPFRDTPALEHSPGVQVDQVDTGSKSWDPAVLEAARKNLAVYIGPMAKVIVTRAAKNARTTDDLYQALASEITSPAEREKFLRSRPF